MLDSVLMYDSSIAIATYIVYNVCGNRFQHFPLNICILAMCALEVLRSWLLSGHPMLDIKVRHTWSELQPWYLASYLFSVWFADDIHVMLHILYLSMGWLLNAVIATLINNSSWLIARHFNVDIWQSTRYLTSDQLRLCKQICWHVTVILQCMGYQLNDLDYFRIPIISQWEYTLRHTHC